MFKLQHQFNNVVKTTQLTNDQMPEFHCYCKCSKCPPPALSSNTNLQSLNLISISQPCQSVLMQTVPDNLKRFLDFGDCFWLCFKLQWTSNIAPKRDRRFGLHSANMEATGPLWWNLDSWPAVRSVRCAMYAGAPSCWKTNLVGSRRLL